MCIFTKAIKAGLIIDTAEFLKSEQAHGSRIVNIPTSIKTDISYDVTHDVPGWCRIISLHNHALYHSVWVSKL